MEGWVTGGVGRTLLSITDNLPMSHDLSLQGSAFIVTAVAMVVVIVAVVAMCVCNQNSSPQLTTITPRKPTMDGLVNHTASPQMTGNHVVVSIPVDSPTDQLARTSQNSNSPDFLSEVNKRENGPNGARSSATLSRQLPDPPVAKETGVGASAGDNQVSGSSDQRQSASSHTSHGEEPVDDYDRLHQPKGVVSDDPGYDHVDRATLPSQRNSVTRNRENIYATPTGESSDSGSGTVVAPAVTSLPVRENIYAVPNGEPSDSGSGIVVAIRENDYTLPSGEDDINYSTIPGKSSRAPSEVYASVDTEYDPYARIDSGNKVTPRLVVAATESRQNADVDSSAAASANASPPAVAPSSTENAEQHAVTFEEDEMYAVVNRPRSSPAQVATPTAPALPDRGYEPEEVGSLPGSGSSHQLSSPPGDPGSPPDNQPAETSATKKRREPSYTEVTARESLASMQQRQQSQAQSPPGGAAAAAPGFQSSKDLPENYYARVDGSSGDGAFSAQGAVAVDDAAQRNGEMYSEINTSGGSYQTIPAPPPVDSLPQLRLRDGQAEGKKKGEELDPEHNEQGYALVLQSTKRSRVRPDPQSLTLPASRSVDEQLGAVDARRLNSSHSRLAENRRSAPLATVESDHDLSIDPGYQMVKDVPELENESDFDPNYETVEETKKKANTEVKTVYPAVTTGMAGASAGAGAGLGHIRLHDYEEVTDVRNRQDRGQESAYDVKKRVLQNHCYEDISDVKEEQKRRKKREL